MNDRINQEKVDSIRFTLGFARDAREQQIQVKDERGYRGAQFGNLPEEARKEVHRGEEQRDELQNAQPRRSNVQHRRQEPDASTRAIRVSSL